MHRTEFDGEAAGEAVVDDEGALEDVLPAEVPLPDPQAASSVRAYTTRTSLHRAGLVMMPGFISPIGCRAARHPRLTLSGLFPASMTASAVRELAGYHGQISAAQAASSSRRQSDTRIASASTACTRWSLSTGVRHRPPRTAPLRVVREVGDGSGWPGRGWQSPEPRVTELSLYLGRVATSNVCDESSPYVWTEAQVGQGSRLRITDAYVCAVFQDCDLNAVTVASTKRTSSASTRKSTIYPDPHFFLQECHCSYEPLRSDSMGILPWNSNYLNSADNAHCRAVRKMNSRDSSGSRVSCARRSKASLNS